MFYSRDNQFHDFTGDDAYRSWLISRNQAPIVHHSGDMHWKRLHVAARHVVNHVKGVFAALRVALVADKMRRAHRDLAQHGIRIPARRDDRSAL
jgi:KaiC/GvpD/RAD55 family RecA-like ATPase